MTDDEIRAVCLKPERLWDDRERSGLYWWFYHEMEDPTEDQLRYWASRYRSKKWCGFLLEKYPTEANYQFISNLFQRTKCDRRQRSGFLNHMLREVLNQCVEPNVDLLSLIVKMGRKSNQQQALQLLIKHFNFSRI